MSFTPHTYTLDDGIQIFFTDSGPVQNSSDYTTLIIFHGSAFTGHGFEKLHDVAKDYNLRTIIWNRRDYPGSTPYTDEELEEIKVGKQVFIERLGKQVLYFIRKFIKEEQIPAASEDRRKGGIALMGWSMGTATEMSLLLDDKLVSSEIYNAVEPFVKDLVLYDPPHRSFGLDEPPADANAYIPWADPDCKTPEELYQNFLNWVSSYYDHPSLSARIHDMDFRKRTDDRTITRFTPEQFAKFYHEPAAVRSELAMYAPPMQAVIAKLRDNAFFDETFIQTYFPRLSVTYLVSERSPWETIWGYNELKRCFKENEEKGKKSRPIKFYVLKGSNHFAHYDNVEELLSVTSQGIRR